MNVEFNYKTVHFYLLSLFSILFILSLTNAINSSIVNIVRNYSLFGIICCTLSWIVIEYIYDEINRTESYYKHIIQDLHTKIVRVHLGLFILLFIVFILYVLL